MTLRIALPLATIVAAALAGAATADGNEAAGDRGQRTGFAHVGTFDVPDNLRPGEDAATVTSAEIVTATRNGTVLVYTDSPAGRLGFVDISNPSAPTGAGVLELEGEPTSTVALGRDHVLVALNTSESYVEPSGELLLVDTRTREVVRSVELAGQPDSIAVSPDSRYAAIAIENERDEDLADGALPQLPAGTLQVLDLKLLRRGDSGPGLLRTVDLTGLAEVAPEDPEPEYVDVNDENEAVVSLQENNHLVIVDLEDAEVVADFSAGTARVENIDATEEELGPQGNGLIRLTESIEAPREPDSVAWLDDDSFATANEGDYGGGTRGFTIFGRDGAVEYESGSSFEHELVRAGHYPEGRSENKGNEPEGLEVGRFGGRTYLFVGSERGNAVGVYRIDDGRPTFLHVLPTGVGPEGILAVPRRNLLAVSAEADLVEDGSGIRSLVTLYRFGGTPSYPQLRSSDEGGLPIPWTAISGLAGDPGDPETMWAVSDSFLAQAYVYEIDLEGNPATIVRRIPVGGVDVADQREGDFDLEAIAARPEGGFWLASEGRTNVGSSRPNLIVRIDEEGAVLRSVELPASLVAKATSSGLEGIAVTGAATEGDETVWVAFQREWKDDPAGFVKLGRYDVAADAWTFALYRLDEVASPRGGWVGLSELALLPDGTFAIVERDNQIARDAAVKRVYRVDPTSAEWRPHGEALDTVEKSLAWDVLDDLDERSVSVPDKVEGLGVTAAGAVYLATDNDGIDDNYGETLFFRLRR